MGTHLAFFSRRAWRLAAVSCLLALAGPVWAQANLSASNLDAPAEYVPGETAEFIVEVLNSGDAADTPEISLGFPAGASISWTCSATGAGSSCPASGTAAGNVFTRSVDSVGARSGGNDGRLRFTLQVALPSGLRADPLALSGSVTDGNDVVTALAGSSALAAETDLAVVFEPASLPGAVSATYTPGSSGQTLSLRISNAGPSDSAGARLSVTLPAEVNAATLACTGATTCTADSGTGSLQVDLPSLAAGASHTAELSLGYPANATAASIDVQASVAVIDASDADPASGNDSQTWRAELRRRARIALTKTVIGGASVVNPGGVLNYAIRVENQGPSDIGGIAGDSGILVSDLLSDQLGRDLSSGACPNEAGVTVPCWRYCATDGGVVRDVGVGAGECPVELFIGNGSFSDQPFQLRAGSSSTLRVYATVSGNASGSLSNRAQARTALASAAVDDQASGNCAPVGLNAVCSQVDVTVEVNSNLSISVDDGDVSATPGLEQAYTVVVRNNGFINANNVRVQTALPVLQNDRDPGFIGDSVRWQCRATPGACCVSSGSVCGVDAPTPEVASAGIDQGVDLPPQGSVTFTLRGRIDPSALGSLVVDAALTPPAGVGDPDPLDNSARDDDTVLVPVAALSLSKVLDSVESIAGGDDDFAPPFRLRYRIEVRNAGPSVAQGLVGGVPELATVIDDLSSDELVEGSAEWTCSLLAAAGATACLQADGTGPLATEVRLDPEGALRFDLDVDTVADPAPLILNSASVTSEAGSASVDIESSLLGRAQLTATLTDGRSEAVPGTRTRYTLTVRNEGPDDAFGAEVLSAFPPELEGAEWSCRATTPIPGDLSFTSAAGAATTPASALALSPLGDQVYVALPDGDAIQVMVRTRVPGQGFGELRILETEQQGSNDPSDSGDTVAGLVRPIDLALSPDGERLHVLAYRPAGTGYPTATRALITFNRISNPADPNYGRLSFAHAVSQGLPDEPRRLLVMADQIYVSGSTAGASQISRYRRDANGLPSSPQAHTANLPSAVTALAVDPQRRRLFVAGSSNRVVQFAISSEAATLGALSVLGPAIDLVDSGGTLLDGISDLRVAADNQTLYVAAGTPGRLALLGYADTGLSLLTSYDGADFGSGGGNPLQGATRLAIAADGEHVFAASASVGGLLSLRRDALGGTLSEPRFLPATSTGLAQPVGLSVSADGRHVLLASAGTGANDQPLVAYARRAPDPLFAFLEREIEGSDGVSGLRAPADVALSADGRHAYVVSLDDQSLTYFERFPRRGQGGDSSGDHLEFRERYVHGQNLGGQTVSGLDRPSRVLLSPDGGNVFVTSEDRNTLAVFSRDLDTGALEFVTRYVDGAASDGLLGAQGMAMDPLGRTLYVAGSFEAAIAIFDRDPATRTLSYRGQVRNGTAGATGLGGIRDLVVSGDGRHLMGVSSVANAVLVFDRDNSNDPLLRGSLRFQQALSIGNNARLMALSVVPGASAGDHVYVVGQTNSTLYVLRRNTDAASAGFGRLSLAFQYRSVDPGLGRLSGARDVQVAADGRRVYVAAQFGNSVLAFDRDLNRAGAGFGGLGLLEVRSDGLEGVDGLDSVYALAVSPDTRNVYAAGFGDAALVSFAVGSGSSCSASGSGDIADSVNLGVNGTLVYEAEATIAPGARGELQLDALVRVPERFVDPTPVDNASTDLTTLTPQGDLALTKSNSQVSVVGGETVRYEVVVSNAGPSHLSHAPDSVVQFNDRLSALTGFAPGSVSWTCSASGSGELAFVDGLSNDAQGVPGLAGVSGLALIADPDAAGPLPSYLAAASVFDNRVLLFRRGGNDGRLQLAASAVDGGGNSLAGARSLAASADGRFLYVASRESDSLSVFELVHGGGSVSLSLRQTLGGLPGLDQAVHVVLGANDAQVYVAGANDGAIAVFARDAGSGLLSWIESEQQGVNDPGDAGGAPDGLNGVEYLVASADGAHLYALSGASGRLLWFERDAGSGRLSYRGHLAAASLGDVSEGLAGAALSADGRQLYVAVAAGDRLLVLSRDANAASPAFGELSLQQSLRQGVDGVQGLLGPRRVLLSPDGQHVYVSAQAGSSLAWFVRDSASGALRFLGLRSDGSGGIDGLGGVTGLAIDPEGRFVYAAGSADAALLQFERSSASSCPSSGSGDLVDVPISVAAGGSLRFVIEAQVASGIAVGSQLRNVASVTAPQDPEPDNNAAEDIDVVSVVADLGILKDDGLAEIDGLAGAAAVVGDASRVYTAGADDNAIGVFARLQQPGGPDDGRLEFRKVLRSGEGTISGLGGVAALALSPDGAHLYAASPIENTVVVLRREPAPTELGFVQQVQNGVLGVSGIAGARALAFSADGRHLYVAGSFSNAVAVFARNADSASGDFGRLQFIELQQNAVGGVDGLGGVAALALSADGRHLYALGTGSNAIAQFTRNPNSGSAGFGRLAFVRSYVNGQNGLAGLSAPRWIGLSADDARVFVLANGTGSLASFARDSASGALSLQGQAREGQGGALGLLGALGARLSPDGQHVYVAAGDAAAVAHYRVSALGAPQFAGIVREGDEAAAGARVLGLAGTADLLLSPDGTQVYALGRSAAALASFERPLDAAPAELSGTLVYRDALFDGQGGVAPGREVSYRIEVWNDGPSSVAQARVIDIFPPEFSGVAWTCASQGGAACPTDGIGNIDSIVQLPVGGRVVFNATGIVGASATGRLINTATVQGIGAVDPDEGNNSSTDRDTVLTPAMDLSVEIADGSASATPGAAIQYLVTARNAGPSYAVGARLSDSAPPALFDRGWRCEPFPKAGALAATQTLPGSLDSYTALVPAGFGRFVYAVGSVGGVGAVALFARDPLSGNLSPPLLPDGIESVRRNGIAGVSGLQGASDLVLGSDERFVYVAGAGSDSIAVFARDADNGSLSFRARYQDGELGIDGIGGVSRLRMSPDGQQLYALGAAENAIAVFAVNPVSGLLSQASVLRQGLGGVDGLNGARDFAFSADGGHLLVIAGANQSLAAFAREAGSGALSPFALLQDFQLDQRALIDPRALAVDGSRILVSGGSGNLIGVFRFAPEDAAPLQLVQSIREGAQGISGLLAPAALAYEDDQERLYVATSAGLLLLSLQGETAQQLEAYAATPPLRLSLSSDRLQLYAASAGGGGLRVWTRERGSRCPLGGSGPIGNQLVDLAPMGRVEFTVDAEVHANALGTLEYGARIDTRLATEELQPANNSATDSNALVPAPDLAARKSDGLTEVVAGLPLSYRIELDNAGVSDALNARLQDPLPLFPAVTAGLVSGEGEWSCSANAPITSLGDYTSADFAALAGVGPSLRSADGARLYAVNPGSGALLVFPLDAQGRPGTPEQFVDGTVLGEATVQGLAGASNLALSADDRHVYVSAASANSLLVFAYDASSDSHRFVQRLVSGSGGVAGLQGAADVELSPDGRFVYVAAASSHAIAVFSRDADSGALSFVERIADGLGTFVPDSNVIRGVRRLQMAADGGRLYAVALQSQAVSSFEVGSDGRLRYLRRLRQDAAGAAGLAGARAIVAAPGETELYVLGSQALSLLRPQADGSLQLLSSLGGLADFALGRELAIDAMGSRLYASDSDGAVHLFARSWADGSLEPRFRLPPLSAPQGSSDFHLGPVDADQRLYVLGARGSLQVLAQRPLSRCLAVADEPDFIDTRLDLGVGGSAALDYAVRVHPSARGVLRNVATVSPGEGVDPDPANNAGEDSTQIRAVSDLSIVKTGPSQAVAGLRLQYVLEVGNAGPSDALGLRVIDDLAPALSDAQWTCVASAGSSCPSSGSGDLDLSANLLVGGSLRIEIDALIASSLVGPLANTASLIPEVDSTDPDLVNNSSSISTDVIAVVDVAVAKSNGADSVVAGAPVAYQIDLSNAGPSDAPQVRLRDLLPAALRDATWACTPSAGASCTAAGEGSLDQIVALAAGSSLRITLVAELAADARGSLSNTASAEVLGAATESDPQDNQATDTDTIEVRHDLAVALLDPLDPFDPGGSIALPYVVQLENLGPSDAPDVRVTLDFSAPLSLRTPIAGCRAVSVTGFLCEPGDMRSGEARVLELALDGLPPAPALLSVTARISGGDGLDPVPANDEATETTELRAGTELRARIDNGSLSLVPGDATVYSIRFENVGSLNASDARIEVPIAEGLIEASWTCTAEAAAACPQPAGSGPIDARIGLSRGQAINIRLSARLDPDVDPNLQSRVVQSARITPSQPELELVEANNLAIDEDLIRFLLFADGFESGTAPAVGSADVLPLSSSCSAAQVDAIGLHDGAADIGMRTLVVAQSGDGKRVLLQLLSTRSGRWLRLSQPGSAVAQGGWLAWNGAGIALAPDPQGLRLEAGGALLQRVAGGPGWRLAPAEGVDLHSLSRCSGASAAAGEQNS